MQRKLICSSHLCVHVLHQLCVRQETRETTCTQSVNDVCYFAYPALHTLVLEVECSECIDYFAHDTWSRFRPTPPATRSETLPASRRPSCRIGRINEAFEASSFLLDKVHPCPSPTVVHGERQQKARAKITPTEFPASGHGRLLSERRGASGRVGKAMLQTQTHEIGRHKRHLLHLYDSNPLAEQSLSQRVNIMARSVHLVRLFDILLWRRSFISRRPSV